MCNILWSLSLSAPTLCLFVLLLLLRWDVNLTHIMYTFIESIMYLYLCPPCVSSMVSGLMSWDLLNQAPLNPDLSIWFWFWFWCWACRPSSSSSSSIKPLLLLFLSLPLSVTLLLLTFSFKLFNVCTSPSSFPCRFPPPPQSDSCLAHVSLNRLFETGFSRRMNAPHAYSQSSSQDSLICDKTYQWKVAILTH